MNSLIQDGFILNYRVEGQGKPALVIGAVDYYPQTFSNYLRRHLQLIFTDHRGFAKSTIPYTQADYTLDKIVEDIEALRAHLQLEKMILIGHSGHAHMATAYAQKYPQHVEHLILIGISPLENPEAATHYFDELASAERKALLAKNHQNPPSNFIGWMLAFGPMLWYQYDYDATHLWQHVHMNEDVFNYLWGNVFKHHDLTQDLVSLDIPIDIILGKYDFFNPPHLWHLFPIHVLEKAGHPPQLEAPQEFDALLLKILQVT